MLISFVVVEPSGTNDRVRTSSPTDEPFCPPLPVVRLGGAVIRASPVRNSDGSHQCNAGLLRTERCEDVPDSAVIHRLSAHLPRTIRTMREDDGVNISDCRADRVEASQVSND
jgi:hypothetical protein